MDYYLYDEHGGYHRQDEDWYLPVGNYSNLDYDQDYYEQKYVPDELYQRYYPPDTAMDNYYDEGHEYFNYNYGYYDYGQYGQSISDEAMITVYQLLQDNEVVMFGLTNCSSCGKAMSQLDRNHVPYVLYNIDSNPYIEDSYYLDVLETLSGIRNVPQLFIRGSYYGDGAKIRAGLERGEVQRLCQCGLYSRLDSRHTHRRHWTNAPFSPGNPNQVLTGNKASYIVQEHLRNNALVLFALSNCDSCTKTESLLIRRHVPFKVFYVDADPKIGMKQYFDTLEALSSNRNFPQLYIRGSYFGDSQRIRKGLESGEIQRLCNCGKVAAEMNQQRQSGLPSVENKVLAIVQQLLRNNKVTLFVFTNCTPCEKTKALLEKHNIPYKEHYIDQDMEESQDQYFDALEPLSGIRTVPQLFIRGKFYGASEHAQEGIDRGEVQRLMR